MSSDHAIEAHLLSDGGISLDRTHAIVEQSSFSAEGYLRRDICGGVSAEGYLRRLGKEAGVLVSPTRFVQQRMTCFSECGLSVASCPGIWLAS